MDVISSNMILFSLYPQERPIESILRSCGSCVGPVAARISSSTTCPMMSGSASYPVP